MLPSGSITTWEQLRTAFLKKYFPQSRTANLKNEILRFEQIEQESLQAAWERFKELLRRCPNHQLPTWNIMQIFYYGLNGDTQMLVDVASGGSVQNKTPNEVYDLLEAMGSNDYRRASD